MIEHILIATDGSKLAENAIERGLSLAKELGSRVTIVCVSERWTAFEIAIEARVGVDNPIERFEKLAAQAAEKVLSAAAEKAATSGIAIDIVHVADRHPADGILETAAARGCDLIVMASHGRSGLRKALLGSVASEVLTRSPVPVLICK